VIAYAVLSLLAGLSRLEGRILSFVHMRKISGRLTRRKRREWWTASVVHFDFYSRKLANHLSFHLSKKFAQWPLCLSTLTVQFSQRPCKAFVVEKVFTCGWHPISGFPFSLEGATSRELWEVSHAPSILTQRDRTIFSTENKPWSGFGDQLPSSKGNLKTLA